MQTKYYILLNSNINNILKHNLIYKILSFKILSLFKWANKATFD